MRREDLEVLLRRVPCPLLRLHLTNGRTFDIDDPDLVVIGRSTVEVLMPHEKRREAVISLLHIVWVEVISPSSGEPRALSVRDSRSDLRQSLKRRRGVPRRRFGL